MLVNPLSQMEYPAALPPLQLVIFSPYYTPLDIELNVKYNLALKHDGCSCPQSKADRCLIHHLNGEL